MRRHAAVCRQHFAAQRIGAAGTIVPAPRINSQADGRAGSADYTTASLYGAKRGCVRQQRLPTRYFYARFVASYSLQAAVSVRRAAADADA